MPRFAHVIVSKHIAMDMEYGEEKRRGAEKRKKGTLGPPYI